MEPKTKQIVLNQDDKLMIIKRLKNGEIVTYLFKEYGIQWSMVNN